MEVVRLEVLAAEITVGHGVPDNVPPATVDWILMNVPIARLALSYDVDGTVVEERVYHRADAPMPHHVQSEEHIQWKRDARRILAWPDTLFDVAWSDSPERVRVGCAAPVGA